MMGAGVAHMIVGVCWKITESEFVTLLEKFGLDTVAVSVPDEAIPPIGYGGTLTVKVTESLVLAAIPTVRVQVSVPTVQLQPPVASLSAVAVRPAGSVKVRTAVLLIGAVGLVLVTFTVNCTPVSF